MTARRLVDIAREFARSGREAVVDGSVRLDYGGLLVAAHATADALVKAGLAPGARVAFLGSAGAGFLISQFATHLARGVWLGLNPKYTPSEHRYVLDDAGASLVVVDVDHDPAPVLDAIEGMRRKPRVQVLGKLEDLAAVPDPLLPGLATLPDDVALLVYTSGTTGSPKGAMLTHAGIMEAARLYVRRYGHPDFRTLLNLPINHVGALIDVTTPAIANGGTLVTQRRFEPAVIPELMREERISLLGQVPAMHLAIDAAAPFHPAGYPHLRHLVWSGAAMPKGWIEQRIDGPAELSSCYGLTESTGSVTFTTPDSDVDTLAETVGLPAQAGLVRIDAGEGEVGEVQVRGPLVMAGYLGRPEETADAFTPDGWLKTGDLGSINGTGALRLAGRSKEMYKSGGYNVYPREVEAALEAHPAVSAAAVLGFADPRWGEVGWAFVLAQQELDAGVLEEFARQRLANYKVPKRFLVRRELPMLPIGKIDKQALRASVEPRRHG